MPEAERLYRQILAADSRHADSLHLLGIIAHQVGRIDAALDLIGKAIGINGTVAAYHSNLGNALKELGRLDEAVAVYNAAIRVKPDYAQAHSNLGVALMDLGRLEDAVAACNAAIRFKPDFAEAHVNLGNALKQLGRPDDAVTAYNAAIRFKPDLAEAHYNLGVALTDLRSLDDAVAAYDTAIRIRPGYAEAYFNLGVTLTDLGRLEDAVAACNTAIRLKPDYAEAHFNLGNALKELGRLDEAVAAYNTAFRIKPDYSEAHSNLGNALKELGRLDEAVAAYNTTIRIKPDDAEAHSNLGAALKNLGRLEDAVAAYNTAIRCKPAFAKAHSNLGVALKELGRLDEAVAAYDTAIRCKPDFAEAHYNLGNVLKALGRVGDAVAAYNTAIRFKPDYVEAHSNLGAALTDLGRFDDAITAYNTAIRFRPGYAEAHYNESFPHFLLGDLATAWPKYEWRWRGGLKELKHRFLTQPQWKGEDISGRTILLHAEQGLGDSILFCRYASLVAARGGRVVLETSRSLLRLLSGLAGVDRLIGPDAPPPDFDYHCPLMSLPGVFETTTETIPANVPYLTAEDKALNKWQTRIGSSGFKIGITWQGNPVGPAEQGRSAPLACFAPLANVPGVRLISLQKVHGLDQLNQIPPGMHVETLGSDFDVGPDAFIDTAAVMMSLDLIVTVDTAIGHLAGALGRPVWLALQAIPHWVWMMDREDSPWYPNTRLFRQRVAGNWSEVFHRMEGELTCMVSGMGRRDLPSSETVTIPVAFGELIDKITILEIKAECITDPVKRENVCRELNLLVGARDQYGGLETALEAPTRDLKAVNKALWDIEDEIRNCENDGDFGMRFVQLARSVYRSNDRRAALKREINQIVGSTITEEKSYRPYGGSAVEPQLPKGLTALKSCRHGRMLFLKEDRYVGRSLDLYGEFSEGEAALFNQLTRSGDTIVEVGANIGAHTLSLARKVGPQGKVYAYEPQRPLFQILCANLALNDLFNVHPLNAACGATVGAIRVPPLDYSQSNNFAGLSLGGAVGELVDVLPVDSLDLHSLRLLKVDVEGMETEVLAGARGTIRRLRPILYVENDRQQHSARLISQLIELGYVMWWHLPPIFSADNHAGNKENVFPGMVSINLFCLPKEMPHQIEKMRPVSGPNDWWNA